MLGKIRSGAPVEFEEEEEKLRRTDARGKLAEAWMRMDGERQREVVCGTIRSTDRGKRDENDIRWCELDEFRSLVGWKGGSSGVIRNGRSRAW